MCMSNSFLEQEEPAKMLRNMSSKNENGLSRYYLLGDTQPLGEVLELGVFWVWDHGLVPWSALFLDQFLLLGLHIRRQSVRDEKWLGDREAATALIPRSLLCRNDKRNRRQYSTKLKLRGKPKQVPSYLYLHTRHIQSIQPDTNTMRRTK